jgi:hypothetical protein
VPRKIEFLLEFFFPSKEFSRDLYRLLKYWAQIEEGLTRSGSCMQHATPNLGGGFEFSPAIVVCKIDVLKFVPFFCAGGGEGKERCWVGMVCGVLLWGLLFVPNS